MPCCWPVDVHQELSGTLLAPLHQDLERRTESGQAPCICPWGPRAVILVVLVLVERKLVRTAEIKQWAFLRDKFKPIEWNCLN